MEKLRQKGACPKPGINAGGWHTLYPLGQGPFSHPPASCVLDAQSRGFELCEEIVSAGQPWVNSSPCRTHHPGFRQLLWASPHKLQRERIKAGGRKRKRNSNQAEVLVWPLPLLMPWRHLYNYRGRVFCAVLNFSGRCISNAFLSRVLIIPSSRQ